MVELASDRMPDSQFLILRLAIRVLVEAYRIVIQLLSKSGFELGLKSTIELVSRFVAKRNRGFVLMPLYWYAGNKIGRKVCL